MPSSIKELAPAGIYIESICLCSFVWLSRNRLCACPHAGMPARLSILSSFEEFQHCTPHIEWSRVALWTGHMSNHFYLRTKKIVLSIFVYYTCTSSLGRIVQQPSNNTKKSTDLYNKATKSIGIHELPPITVLRNYCANVYTQVLALKTRIVSFQNIFYHTPYAPPSLSKLHG